MSELSLDRARALADAVLVEGYALYPYRASAPKNRYRWTFGVLAPRAWSEDGGCEAWWLEAQILVAGRPREAHAQLRFFQVERRRTEGDVADAEGAPLPWDEGILQTVELPLVPGETEIAIAFPGLVTVEPLGAGRVVRTRGQLHGRISIARTPIPIERNLERITIRIENHTPWPDRRAARDTVMLGAMASTHLVIGTVGGELISAIDPPPWASAAAASCASVRTYPTLAGPPGCTDLMIAAPFILHDHPQLAPESAGDTCDATEIDELLVLRTQTLTDAEKRDVRATDARAAAILDRAEAMPAAELARMHGATRDLRDGEMVPDLPVGAKVRLRAPVPGTRMTDAQDLLYAGHIATVVGLRDDVDGTRFIAVTIDDDPAAELNAWYGRYHYYRLDELEPL